MAFPKIFKPGFPWIEVITTGVLSAVTLSLIALAIRCELEISDVLGVASAIGGAGVGAGLAASAARASVRAQSDREMNDRHEFVRCVLETVGEEMQGGTTVDTQNPRVDFSGSFGTNQLERHATRTELALSIVNDANDKVGADFQSLLALHTAIRSLRQTRDQISEMMARRETADFGRKAMEFIQANRNSVRISINRAQRTLDMREERSGRFSELFRSSTSSTSQVT